MRYGAPSIPDRLSAMKDAGCERILLAPLYPQYCAATTATANDLAFATLAGMRWQPALRTLPPYYDNPDYLDALQRDIEGQLSALDFEPQRLLLSYHGMPERTLRKGDPYHCHCRKTARLLGERLSISVDTSFQSRFGRDKWLEPATDDVLKAYPSQGITRIAIAASPDPRKTALIRNSSTTVTLPPSITRVNPSPEPITSGDAPIICRRVDARGAARSPMSAATMAPNTIDCPAARAAPSASCWPIRRETRAVAPIDSPMATV